MTGKHTDIWEAGCGKGERTSKGRQYSHAAQAEIRAPLSDRLRQRLSAPPGPHQLPLGRRAVGREAARCRVSVCSDHRAGAEALAYRVHDASSAWSQSGGVRGQRHHASVDSAQDGVRTGRHVAPAPPGGTTSPSWCGRIVPWRATSQFCRLPVSIPSPISSILTSPVLAPVGKIPKFKSSAARIEKTEKITAQ